MQIPTMTEMTQSFNAAYAAQNERALAAGRQLTDWQLAQARALETSTKTAVQLSFSAMEQAISASYEMNRLFFAAFAPPKAEEKAQA